MHTLAIIPARYASTRFPAKPLALLGGKPIIQWVYKRVEPLFDKVVVATDDERIASVVERFGGEICMTDSNLRSGTDRCGAVLQKMNISQIDYDVVVNVQGDEPFVSSEQITTLLECFNEPSVETATLKKRIFTAEELSSPNNVKVVTDNNGRALYFSRYPIPYCRSCSTVEDCLQVPHYKHIGIYAFRPYTLLKLVKLDNTTLEYSESLEQLRWLENGYSIQVAETTSESIGIDTQDDLLRAEGYIQKNNIKL